MPTVDALAYNLVGHAGLVCPLMDARRNQTYTGLILLTAMRWKYSEQCAVGIDEIISIVNQFEQPVTFLGDGVPVFQEYIAENCSVPYTFAPAHVNKQRAGAVAALGMKYFAEGRSETAAEHKPEYLRLSQAERNERGRISMITVRAMQVKDAEQVSELERMIFSQPWSYQGFVDSPVCRTRFFWLRKKIIRS